MSSSHCIVRRSDGKVLVHAKRPDQIQHIKDAWYFHPDCVDPEIFEVSDRIYSCPDRGDSYWVDLKIRHAYINDAAWVFPHPKPGYEHIAGWYGFYTDHAAYRCVPCDDSQ